MRSYYITFVNIIEYNWNVTHIVYKNGVFAFTRIYSYLILFPNTKLPSSIEVKYVQVTIYCRREVFLSSKIVHDQRFEPFTGSLLLSW